MSNTQRFSLTDNHGLKRTFTGVRLGRNSTGDDFYVTDDSRVVVHRDDDRVHVTNDPDDITAMVTSLSDGDDGELASAIARAAQLADGIPL